MFTRALRALPPRAPNCATESRRAFYFPRKNWFPWRVRYLKEEQRVGRIRRHLFPGPPRSAEEAAARKEEEPIFGGGPLLSFTKEDIPLRVKRMVTYRRLLAKKQIDDAIEWLECLHRPSSQPVLDLLKRARRICVEQKGLDAARLYLQILMPQRGYVIKDGKLTRAGFMHIYRRPRHKLRIVLREMPLAECYQRWYVMKKPPRAMAVDMRLAIHENRVGPRAVREWAPYMTSASRSRRAAACGRAELLANRAALGMWSGVRCNLSAVIAGF